MGRGSELPALCGEPLSAFAVFTPKLSEPNPGGLLWRLRHGGRTDSNLGHSLVINSTSSISLEVGLEVPTLSSQGWFPGQPTPSPWSFAKVVHFHQLGCGRGQKGLVVNCERRALRRLGSRRVGSSTELSARSWVAAHVRISYENHSITLIKPQVDDVKEQNSTRQM